MKTKFKTRVYFKAIQTTMGQLQPLDLYSKELGPDHWHPPHRFTIGETLMIKTDVLVPIEWRNDPVWRIEVRTEEKK